MKRIMPRRERKERGGNRKSGKTLNKRKRKVRGI